MNSSSEVKNKSRRFLFIDGIHDEKSGSTMEEKLSQLEHVESAKFDVIKGGVDLYFNSKSDALHKSLRLIEELGYGLSKQRKTFSVYGMSCAACVSRVEKRLWLTKINPW